MSGSVAVVDHRFDALDIERRILGPLDIAVVDARELSDSDTRRLCQEADGILVGARHRFDGDAISQLRRCRAIVRYGVGVDNIDVEAAAAAGIWVAAVPDYCVEEVADHALALLLALNRRLHDFDADIRSGRWGIPRGLRLRRLSHSTLGVVGFGRIGEEVGRRGLALGMTVLAFDPGRPARDIRAAGAEPTALEDLLARADYVSLHAPDSSGAAILDRHRIAGMKQGACVINVARGALVDEQALAEALRSGHVGGAALDVARSEPLLPGDPLLDASNVVVTPHAAWYSLESIDELRTKASEEIARVLSGGLPRHPINVPQFEPQRVEGAS